MHQSPDETTRTRREELLRARLVALIDNALAHMIETGNAEPSMMALVANASATIAALNARKQSIDPTTG